MATFYKHRRSLATSYRSTVASGNINVKQHERSSIRSQRYHRTAQSCTNQPAKVSSTLDGLVQRVHALPPQLFDDIRDIVFGHSPSNKTIDKSTRPPPQLSFDRATRTAFTKNYYGNGSSFEFASGSKRVLLKWFVSLPPDHRAFIRHRYLHLYTLRPACQDPWATNFHHEFSKDVYGLVVPALGLRGIALKDGVFIFRSSGRSGEDVGYQKQVREDRVYMASGTHEPFQRLGYED